MTSDAPRDIAPDAALHFVMNAGSGTRNDDATLAAIEQGLAGAPRPFTLHRVARPADLAEVARKAVAAAGADGVVVAVGGDGTINTVASAVMAGKGRLALVPRGTFNYFSRTHGVPTEAEAAVQLLRTGTQVFPVQAGRINERLFLVNASVGLYPRLLEDREAFKQQFGRNRLVAMASAVFTVMRGHRTLRLRITPEDGPERSVRTSTLFVGNNRLQMEQIGVDSAPKVEAGHLAGIVLRAFRPGEMLWLALRGAFGRLGDAENVLTFSFREITVTPRRESRSRSYKIATDGEVARLDSPLRFRVDPDPLWLLKPPPAPG